MPKRALTEFELYVLLALAHLEPEAYGLAIMRQIEERAGRPVAIGAVYTALSRLEARGLVHFSFSDPRPVPGGRARKYAHLTRPGEQALRQATGMLRQMMAGLPAHLRPEPGEAR